MQTSYHELSIMVLLTLLKNVEGITFLLTIFTIGLMMFLMVYLEKKLVKFIICSHSS